MMALTVGYSYRRHRRYLNRGQPLSALERFYLLVSIGLVCLAFGLSNNCSNIYFDRSKNWFGASNNGQIIVRKPSNNMVWQRFSRFGGKWSILEEDFQNGCNKVDILVNFIHIYTKGNKLWILFGLIQAIKNKINGAILNIPKIILHRYLKRILIIFRQNCLKVRL